MLNQLMFYDKKKINCGIDAVTNKTKCSISTDIHFFLIKAS